MSWRYWTDCCAVSVLRWGVARSSIKVSYYRRAIFGGITAAQIVSMVALAALFVTIALTSHKTMLRADLQSAAGRMLWVFLPYAALVLFNLALRLAPSMDIRIATSVFMLGPLTAVGQR